MVLMLLCGSAQPFVRVAPLMIADAVFACVHRNDLFGPDIGGGLCGFLRQQVDIVPGHIVLAAFHQGEVKAAEACADFLEMLSVTSVAADKNAAVRQLQCKAAPKRLIAL